MPCTVRPGATDATVAAAYRGALTAQRERLHALCVDVVSDGPWPADVRWAVDRIVYDGNDTGTSAWFALTEEEHAATVHYMASHDGEPQDLIPFTRR